MAAAAPKVERARRMNVTFMVVQCRQSVTRMSRNMNMLTSDAFIGKIELFLSWTIDQLGFRVLFQLNRRSLVVVAAGQGMPCFFGYLTSDFKN